MALSGTERIIKHGVCRARICYLLRNRLPLLFYLLAILLAIVWQSTASAKVKHRARGRLSKAAKAGPAEPAKPADPGKDIIVAANVSVIQLSTYWWPLSLLKKPVDGDMTFFIRSRSTPIGGVQITSMGIGAALFTLAGPANFGDRQSSEKQPVEQTNKLQPASSGCVESSAEGTPCLLLCTLDEDGQRIRMRVPASQLANPGTSADGKIIILAPGQARVEVPVKLLHPPSTLSTTFFSITIPALLTFALGYLTSVLTGWRTLRVKQKYLFFRYKERRHEELTEFFRVPYLTLLEGDAERFAPGLFELLRERGHLQVIPDRQRRRLERCIRGGKRECVKQALSRLFPEWKEAIKQRPKKP